MVVILTWKSGGKKKVQQKVGRIHVWNLEVYIILGKKFALLEHGQSATNADEMSRAETQVRKAACASSL